MELISYSNLWYGIQYEEPYEDDDEFQDAGRTARRVARRSKSNAPVRKGDVPNLYKNNTNSRGYYRR